MRRLSLRSHHWGVLVIVVAAGEINAEGADVLGSHLKKLQLGNNLVVDLWDVAHIDAAGIAALEAAKRRADEAGWGFAVVADPAGPLAKAVEAGHAGTIPTFSDRHDARAALQHVPQ